MLKLNELLTVGEWYEMPISDITEYDTALEYAFKKGTSIAEGSTTHELFSEIYIPVKLATSSGEPETITWKNVGLSGKEIAGYYDDLYHSCRLAVKNFPDGFYLKSFLVLQKKISRVVNINLRKYLKMMELDGFYYNPLWNVDGVETFATAEHEGTRTDFGHTKLGATVDEDGAFADGDTVKTTHNVSAYDTTTMKHESDDTSEGTTADWRSYTNNGLDKTVSSTDDPFGNGLDAEMRYHIEKRVRQGNIGVTKTQELIESERANLRFNVIEEFFKDLNKSILVGIYD